MCAHDEWSLSIIWSYIITWMPLFLSLQRCCLQLDWRFTHHRADWQLVRSDSSRSLWQRKECLHAHLSWPLVRVSRSDPISGRPRKISNKWISKTILFLADLWRHSTRAWTVAISAWRIAEGLQNVHLLRELVDRLLRTLLAITSIPLCSSWWSASPATRTSDPRTSSST